MGAAFFIDVEAALGPCVRLAEAGVAKLSMAGHHDIDYIIIDIHSFLFVIEWNCIDISNRLRECRPGRQIQVSIPYLCPGYGVQPRS